MCISGYAPRATGLITTVAISDLQCEVTYTIMAEGTLNGAVVGLRSSHGNITGPCPPVKTGE